LTINNEMMVFFKCWRLSWLKEKDSKKVVVIWKLRNKMLFHHNQ
jgi:hypothetical protein